MHNFDELINRRNSFSLKWDSMEDGMLPMWVADMDFKAPPPVIEALHERVAHGVFGYTGAYEPYYTAFINWMKKRFHWVPRRGWLSISPGIVPAMDMLIRALTHPGDRIVIQPPVYPPFYSLVRNNGRQLVENRLTFDGHRYLMDLDELKSRLNSRVKMLLLCSPHNPVGRVWSSEELEALGKICLEREIVLVSDEIHSDLILPGHKHKVFADVNSEFEQNCIICCAPSKTFNLAGLILSNIIIPNQKLRSVYRHVLSTSGLDFPNVLALTAAEAAYTRAEAWLDELLGYIYGNYLVLNNFIKERLPEIQVIEPEATYLVWLDFRGLDLDDEQVERLLKEKARLVLSPGRVFGCPGFQRINIACPRPVLEDALLRLEKAFRF